MPDMNVIALNVSQAGMYEVVAEMLDLQPEDELLDIGCGPGAFLASKGQRVRRVAGLDASPVMLRDAERRLADRLAAGTARLVLGSSAELPFGDGEFSAVTVISAPVNLAEVFRVEESHSELQPFELRHRPGLLLFASRHEDRPAADPGGLRGWHVIGFAFCFGRSSPSCGGFCGVPSTLSQAACGPVSRR